MPLARPSNLLSIPLPLPAVSTPSRQGLPTFLAPTTLASSHSRPGRSLPLARHLSNSRPSPATMTAAKDGHAPAANIRHAASHHHAPERRIVPAPYVFQPLIAKLLNAKFCLNRSDYDTSFPRETRKYLRTYGLIPPAVETYENQSKRCGFSIGEAFQEHRADIS